MKNFFMTSTLLAVALCSLPALAFPPSIFYGSAFFIAKQDCPDLGIVQNESLSIAADYTHFDLFNASSSTGNGFEPIFRFAVPTDGAYVFTGDAGLQRTDEFLTHAWSGQDVYDFHRNPATGNILITHGGPNPTTRCILTNNTGG